MCDVIFLTESKKNTHLMLPSYLEKSKTSDVTEMVGLVS